MDPKESKILRDHAYCHWYYISKDMALRKFIKNINFGSILDVGAGSGIFSKQLLRNTDAEKAMCLDIAYTSEKKVECSGKKIEFKRNVSASDADLVLLMDVIEHVEDDVAFIKEYSEKVGEGTYFAVTVPAFQALFSEHDVFLGHRRRYSMRTIKKCLSSAGLKIVKSNYFFFSILPIAVFIRVFKRIKMRLFLDKLSKKSDLKMHEKMLNRLLIFINKMELNFFPKNKIAGLSIFCLAVKGKNNK